MEASTPKEAPNNAPALERPRRRWPSLEIIGESILLLIVGGFFVYLFVESLDWPLGSALMPWIAVAIGAPFWLWRAAVLFFRAKESSGEIMDIGFRSGEDAEGERGRFIRICCFIVGLYLAIWLLGFHIAMPAGILFYVRVYGKMSWVGSVFLALFFVVLLFGVYDHLLNATWHEPPVLQWIYSFFPDSE
jgi:hypothetical protein